MPPWRPLSIQHIKTDLGRPLTGPERLQSAYSYVLVEKAQAYNRVLQQAKKEGLEPIGPRRVFRPVIKQVGVRFLDPDAELGNTRDPDTKKWRHGFIYIPRWAYLVFRQFGGMHPHNGTRFMLRTLQRHPEYQQRVLAIEGAGLLGADKTEMWNLLVGTLRAL